ncbi:hypothetical protein [Streptomyces sp. CB03911]|uniref:hypothetical protein n=1 Tax=Streptomyces sp. CB03911 TaxID=1804758 RepID=UPI00093FD530|nr:hypothetical protein [Streptomyces sp. CB03911]OKI19280.1 hypothetical protein A6A07_07200 [Streptomyces sp. CB03911]
MKDSFGVLIEPGDYILSAAMSTGTAKLGIVYQLPNGGLMMEPASHGMGWRGENKRAPLGAMVAVLRKADGTIPGHVASPEAAG